MIELKSGLLTNKYTRVLHEPPTEQKFNAPHHFMVVESIPNNEKYFGNTEYVEPRVLAEINFQEGPIKENGVNGVANEDLINMIICRLESFQKSPYQCRENAIAITKLQESLMWLRKRTQDREARGVEGTNVI